jgi:hypothetical protein
MDYTADPRFTGAGNDERLQQTRDDVWRTTFNQGIDQWLAGRKGYAQDQGQKFVAANQPGAEIAYRDDRRNAAFRSARTGTTGGSMDAARRGTARAAYAARLARIMAGGQQIEQQQVGSDMQTAEGLRTEGYQQPGRDHSRAALLAGFSHRADTASTLGQLEAQRNAVQQQYNDATAQAMSAWMPS